MRATFMNRLVFAEPENQNTIRYVHQYRVDANIYIQKKNVGPRDWDVAIVPAKSMSFYGAKSVIPDELRQSLLSEFMHYIRRRVRHGVEKVTFDDFISMTRATNIA